MSVENGVDSSKTRILLVEDHASFRQALAFMFEREEGFSVVGQAGSLAEARQFLNGSGGRRTWRSATSPCPMATGSTS